MAVEPDTGPLPQLLALATLSIGEPTDALARLRPVPDLSDHALEEAFLAPTAGTGHPIATAAFEENRRSAAAFVSRSVFLYPRVQLVSFEGHFGFSTWGRRPLRLLGSPSRFPVANTVM